MKLNTVENKLLLACYEVIEDISLGANEYSPLVEDDITVLAFDNDFLKEINLLKEKLVAWKNGAGYEN